MDNKYYIAYGSNLNVRQMYYRCPSARIRGTAELKDWQLLFKGGEYGAYLTIEREEGAVVPVAVWEITPDDEQELDRYEGYPYFYYKDEFPLEFKNIDTGEAETRTVMVYIMHEEAPLGAPTPSYLETCRQGYLNFDFDTAFLYAAVERSRPNSQ